MLPIHVHRQAPHLAQDTHRGGDAVQEAEAAHAIGAWGGEWAAAQHVLVWTNPQRAPAIRRLRGSPLGPVK